MPRPSERLPRFTSDLEVVRLIGRGGMGSVFEVVSTRTGARYAAKTVIRETDERAMARFRREAELLARCDRHPGVVKVHSIGETADGVTFILLDLVPGETLEGLLTRERRLEPRRAATLALEVTRALAFVHAQGVIHRDVKPSNILLDAGAGDAPRLTDFGLATAEDVERLTSTGEFVGTISYCAPEQLESKDATALADIFSVGAVLFRSLGGDPPFEGPDPLSTIARLLSPQPAPDVRTLAREVPEPLARVVAHALAKAPADRYPDALALAADLERFLDGKPVLARPPRRGLRRVGLVGLVGLALAGMGAAGLALAREMSRREAREKAATAAEDAVARAGRALAHAREAHAIGAATSASEAAVAEARLESERALALSAQAGRAGSKRATAASEAANASLAEVALLETENLIGAGRPADALVRLESSGASTPEARLLRARALVALGRTAEGRREAEVCLEAAGATAPLLEAAADVLAASGDAARAAKLYSALLAGAGRRALEVRAKRGGAAFDAGDETMALGDLERTIPDPSSLPRTRAANAKLAPIARVLYSRGLSSEGSARERDLEGAWRLADPPPALADAVGRHWSEGVASDMETTLLQEVALDSIGLAKLRRIMELSRRARLVAPEATFAGRMRRENVVLAWANNQSTAEPLLALANKLLPVDSDNPVLLYVAARGLTRARDDDPEARGLLDRAMAALPDRRDPGVEAIAGAVVDLALTSSGARAMTSHSSVLDLDFDLTSRAALIANDAGLLVRIAGTSLDKRRLDVARRCLDAAASTSDMEHASFREDVAETRVRLLHAEGKPDEAIAFARSFDAGSHSPRSLAALANALILSERWDDVMTLLRSRPDAPPKFLFATRQLLESAGRLDDARELGRRLEATKGR